MVGLLHSRMPVAEKKAVMAACEQCGGNRVPVIHEVMSFAAWTKAQTTTNTGPAFLLSLRPGTQGLRATVGGAGQSAGNNEAAITFLSGPEGGLSDAEEDMALARGFAPVTLGPRVLRAETAALCALAALLL